MALFTQIIILLAVLVAMVLVLLAIRQLSNFEGFDDAEETHRLKEEVVNEDKVLSRNNIFHTLVDSDNKKNTKTEKVYNDNSKDPFSPKE